MTKHLITLLLLCNLLACAMSPFNNDIKQGHFRIENTSYDNSQGRTEYVYLMCHKHKPATWVTARQYPAGKHNIWVKATYQEANNHNSYQVAFANFNLTLPAGGNYQLAHTIHDESISIWLQDINTLSAKSEVVTAKLTRNNIANSTKLINQCKQGTV